MIRYIFRFLYITICAVLLQGFGDLILAQTTDDVSIDLKFEETDFAENDPIPVKVTVSNTSGRELLITEGFTSTVFYLRMCVIDPAGRLLTPVDPEKNDVREEYPDAPPLPYVLYEGRPVMVTGCEVFPKDEAIVFNADDLRKYYDMTFPGYYSAQVQISATVFNNPTCAVEDYAWRKLLTSETVYFYVHTNSTGAQVIPDQWKLSWLSDDKNVPDVQVQIRSLEGQQVEDIDLNSITLNGVANESVNVLPPKLKAYFKAKDAVQSLDAVQVGKWYWVTIKGTLKTGRTFAAQQQIRVVK